MADNPFLSKNFPWPSDQHAAETHSQSKQPSVTDINPDATREQAEANQAAVKLRAANKYETTFQLELLGDLSWHAGTCVTVDQSLGKFAGKYAIDKVIHRIARNGKGYIVNIDGHKVLMGY